MDATQIISFGPLLSFNLIYMSIWQEQAYRKVTKWCDSEVYHIATLLSAATIALNNFVKLWCTL